jgi:hypothetical protein
MLDFGPRYLVHIGAINVRDSHFEPKVNHMVFGHGFEKSALAAFSSKFSFHN